MCKDVGDFIDLSLAELKLMPLSPGITRKKSQFNTWNGNVEMLKQQSIQHQAFSTSVILPAIKPGFEWRRLHEKWKQRGQKQWCQERHLPPQLCSWANWLKFLCCFSLLGHPNTHPPVLPTLFTPHLLSQQNRFLHHPPRGWEGWLGKRKGLNRKTPPMSPSCMWEMLRPCDLAWDSPQGWESWIYFELCCLWNNLDIKSCLQLLVPVCSFSVPFSGAEQWVSWSETFSASIWSSSICRVLPQVSETCSFLWMLNKL